MSFFFFLFLFMTVLGLLVFVWGLSLVVASGGHSSSRCGGRSSSRCAGLSLSRPLPLWGTGSRRTGSVVVAHGPSCSAACGIFPDQGSNPCPLHWQADSQPLHHQGSPIGVSYNRIIFLGVFQSSFSTTCRSLSYLYEIFLFIHLLAAQFSLLESISVWNCRYRDINQGWKEFNRSSMETVLKQRQSGLTNIK